MKLVERRFTQIFPAPEGGGVEPQPLSAFMDHSAFVVVGDPGAGKTTTFREVAKLEQNAVFLTVRQFLRLSPGRWRDRTLYLDGLDEQRAKYPDGTSALDRVIDRLDKLGNPKFRLSCREADWYGSMDAQALRDVSGNQVAIVLRLEPLRIDDVAQIAEEWVDDPEAFVAEAHNRNVEDLLLNPESLRLLLEVVSKEGWPDSQLDLYERACELLCVEHNEDHARAATSEPSRSEILDASGKLCAVHLCAGTAGWSLVELRSDLDFPAITRLDGNQKLLHIAARRKLFSSEGPERVVPVHRRTAEFLAARFLAKLARSGYPPNRVLALITGNDGGTLADLRGLFAWLVSLCPELADSLIPRDPLGVVLYGDVTHLPASTKRVILERLAALAGEDPWFGSEDWSSRPFGALASSEMELIFRSILVDPEQPPALLACVLDAIAHGAPLPRLRNVLLSLVRSNQRPSFLRERALIAFKNACPGGTNDLMELLDEINEERVSDDERRLRGSLLRILYPQIIKPDRIVSYLVDEAQHIISNYHMFVSFELVATTEVPELPTIVNSVLQSANLHARRHELMWESFFGKLLVRTVLLHGVHRSPETLYRWLDLGLDEYGSNTLRNDEAKEVKDFFESHPNTVCSLFDHWLSITKNEKHKFAVYEFWERLHYPDPPTGFGQWLINRAASEPDLEVANFLFREAFDLRVWRNRDDAPTLDDLFEHAERHPRFAATLNSAVYCEISGWRRKMSINRSKRERERTQKREINVEYLSRNLAQIRSGTALSDLCYLAKIFLGMFIDVDRELSPERRLLEALNIQITEAALEGFIASLLNAEIPSPHQIGDSYACGRTYDFGFVVVAGMSLLAKSADRTMLKLPENTLGAAICFRYANLIDTKWDWHARIIVERPNISAAALEAFWRPQLMRGQKHILGLHDLVFADWMVSVAESATLSLLRDHFSCKPTVLEDLLSAAFNHSDRNELLEIAREVLGRTGAVKGVSRALWYAAAYLLAPNEFEQKVVRYVGRSEAKAWPIMEFILPSGFHSRSLDHGLQPRALEFLARIFGRIFKPVPHPMGVRSGSRNPDDAAEHVHYLINRLGSDPSQEAAGALKRLKSNKRLSAWSSVIAHAVAIQTRKRREAAFQYPALEQVVETLCNNQPANAADLQAIVTDYLRTLGGELPHGPTDRYGAFWNTDSNGKLVKPKHENECRDRLLDHLRPKLFEVGVTAEPEGHYAQDKRADIKAICGQLNLPVEIKKHSHRELWRAPTEQLRKLYMCDPGTEGRGIYLVLWFGENAGPIPTPPKGILTPHSPEDLEQCLMQLVSKSDHYFIEFVVLDCSGKL